MIINSWLSQHAHPSVCPDEIPNIGFVATSGRKNVAAAFLRQCEGNLAILDGLVTNPAMDGKTRNEAIDTLVTHIIKTGVNMGLRGLLAYSRDSGTIERSKKHGFGVIPMTLISKDLTSKATLCQ